MQPDMTLTVLDTRLLPSKSEFSALNQLKAVNRGIDQVAGDFDLHLTRLNASNHFTAEGLKQRIGELADDTLKRLDRFTPMIEKARDQLQQLELSVQGAAEQSDLRTVLKHTEIRNYLLSLSHEARLEVVQKGFDEKDMLLIDAVIDAPEVLELLPFPAYAESLKKQAYEVKNPAKAEEIRVYAELLEAIQQNDRNVRTQIYAAAGLDINALENLWYENEEEQVLETEQNSPEIMEENLDELNIGPVVVDSSDEDLATITQSSGSAGGSSGGGGPSGIGDGAGDLGDGKGGGKGGL